MLDVLQEGQGDLGDQSRVREELKEKRVDAVRELIWS